MISRYQKAYLEINDRIKDDDKNKANQAFTGNFTDILILLRISV